MRLPDWLVRIARFIVRGREAGLFNQKNSPGELSKPAKPEDIKGIKP
jgi:hypothetical protein